MTGLAGGVLAMATLAMATLGTADLSADGALVCLSAEPVPPVAAHRLPPAFDPAEDERLRAMYGRALPFSEFLQGATRRRTMWLKNYREGTVADAAVARARAVGGTWYLLAVAVDGCSDSVNTIPYMALLADRVPGLELRVLDPDAGREIMESRRTPDGRAATPTVVLLDENFEDAGCFVERPGPLIAWIAEREAALDGDGIFAGKMAWYDRDQGASTVEDVVAMMEAAGRGEDRCAPRASGVR